VTFLESLFTWRPFRTTRLLHRALMEIRVLGDRLMTIADDLNAKLDTLTESLSGIHADIVSLKDQLAAAIDAGAGSISAADAEALLAKVTTMADTAAGIDAETT